MIASPLEQQLPALWFDLRDSRSSEGWRGGSALSLAEIGRRLQCRVWELGDKGEYCWTGGVETPGRWMHSRRKKCGNGSEEFPK